MPASTKCWMARGAALFLTCGATAATIHVDDDAPNDPGPNDPLVSDPLEDGSLAHPFDAIQEAIDAAHDGDVVEIASGTYTGAGNRAIDFGGRVITVRGASDDVTIDLEQTSDGFIFQSGESAAARLERLRVINGFADFGGTGIRCTNASMPTIRACVFSNHMSFDARGGVVQLGPGSDVRFESCDFIGNEMDLSFKLEYAGGMAVYAEAADVVFDGCRFEDTFVNTVAGFASGAVWIKDGSAVFLECGFRRNRIFGDEVARGGGVFLEDSPGTFINCGFSDCEANGPLTRGQGGAIAAVGAPIEVIGGAFANCGALTGCGGRGGAIFASEAGCHIEAAHFMENYTYGSGCAGSGSGKLAALDCTGAKVLGCIFISNSAGGGSLFAGSQGGAMPIENEITRCVFVGNRARHGAALANGFNVNSTIGIIDGCLFHENRTYNAAKSSGTGGAIRQIQNSMIVRNCTFIANTALPSAKNPGLGGAIMKTDDAIVINCILRDNVPDQLTTMSGVSYSNVQGASAGNGNIDADPMFVDAANGDFRLLAGSPCIDAGSSLEPYGELDLDGQPRRVDDPATPNTGAGDAPHPDMGAYEYQPIVGACAADLNASGSVDFNDVLIVLGDWGTCAGCASDLNGDGAVTLSDLLLVLAAWGPCP